MYYKGYFITVCGVLPAGGSSWEANYAIRSSKTDDESPQSYGVVAGAFDTLDRAESEALRIAQYWVDQHPVRQH